MAKDTCLVVGKYKGYPVVAQWVDGLTTHLGIDIFGKSYKAESNQLLCDFTERYLLELLSLENEQARSQRMYDNGVMLIGDLHKIPLWTQTSFRFKITFVEGRRYRMEWHNAGELLLSISVPAQCELIYGMNKIELENSFRNSVLRHRERPVDDTKLQEKLVRLSEQMYVLREGYYLLEQMQCTSFYTQQNNRFIPICDIAYPAESLQNLLTVPTSSRNYTLDISQRKYGFRTDEFMCPLSRLIDFCLAQGCKPYMGVESEENGVITAALIMVNAEYGYNHVFKIVFPSSLLSQSNGHIQVTLNAYTPTHNLGSLYDDDRQIRHRKSPKIKL